MTTCLGKLMEGVQRNLEPKNRDKFTQVRCSALRQSLVTPAGSWLCLHVTASPSLLL